MQHQTLTFVHRTVPDAPLVEDERQDPYAVTVVEPVFGEVYDETYSTGHFAHEPGHLVVIPRGRLDTREEMMAEVAELMVPGKTVVGLRRVRGGGRIEIRGGHGRARSGSAAGFARYAWFSAARGRARLPTPS